MAKGWMPRRIGPRSAGTGPSSSSSTSTEPRWRSLRELRWGRIALLIGAAAALYFAGRAASEAVVEQFDLHLRGSNEPLLHRAIMSATAVYAALMLIPFMPAVEIGLSMLMVFGGRIALLVYLATVAALAAGFLLGRLVPPAGAARAFGALGLARAAELAGALAPLSRPERIAWLARRFPLLRYRYLALALLLNLPGNIVIGGGGGIALAAGMTRLYSFPAYLLTVALAVAPVPLAVRLAGG